MRKSTIQLLISGVLVLAGLFQILNFNRVSPPFDSAPHRGLGEVMAEQAAKTVSSGGKVILIARDTQAFASDAADIQVSAFLKRLAVDHVSVVSTQWIKADPLRIPSVPQGDFFGIVKRAGDHDVVVSFLGPPMFDDAQVAKLGSDYAKVVALCTGGIPRQTDLGQAFRRGVLKVAIVDRPSSSISGGSSGSDKSLSPRAAFDRWYQVVDASSYGDWAAARGKGGVK